MFPMAGMGQHRSAAVVETLDFYRTLADLCGLQVPEHVQVGGARCRC